jgi:hypothetical protein
MDCGFFINSLRKDKRQKAQDKSEEVSGENGFTDYKPKTHNLEKLDSQACKLDCRFKTIFLRVTVGEERCFNY